ncbi:O-antigen ligase family protein [beta proteobacterium MWH-UniP1]
MQNLIHLARYKFFPLTTERLAGLLLFLFPICAVSVRHWVSAIFLLFALLAIFNLRSLIRSSNLSKHEVWLLVLMAIFFVVYLISSFVNGWSDRSIRLWERELRFLLFVPVYLLVRQRPNPLAALGCGAAIAVFLTAVIAPVQAYLLGYGRDLGVYGPLFTGPITALFLIVAIAWAHAEVPVRFRRALVAALFIATLIVAVLTSRSSILGTSLILLGYYLFTSRDYRYLLAFVFLGVAIVGAHEVTEVSTAPRLGTAFQEAKNYITFQINHPGEINPHAVTSVGTRLEMLRSLQFFLRDYPVWGAGGYNYHEVISGYISKGLVAESVAFHAHPHNVFAQVLVSKGIVGLIIFLGIIFMSAFLLRRAETDGAGTSRLTFGLLFLAALILMSFTESALVLKGNFIACGLLLLCVFLADRQRRETFLNKKQA